jgi:hypothetical protein
MGNKASTALSAPISQAVISKRPGPEGELDVLSSSIAAIEYGKIHGNTFKELTRFSPCDARVLVKETNSGTYIVLNDEKYIFIPIEEENICNIDVKDGDYVFTGQPLVWRKNSNPYERVHPVLSFSVADIESDAYSKEKDSFVRNPSKDVVQFSRYFLYRHYISLIGFNTPIAKTNFATLVFEQLKFGVVGKGKYRPISELIDSEIPWELRFLSGEKLVAALGTISSFIFRDALGGLRESSKEFTPERSYTANWVLGGAIPAENFPALKIETLSKHVIKRENKVSPLEQLPVAVQVTSSNPINLLDIVETALPVSDKQAKTVLADLTEPAEKTTVDLANKFADLQVLIGSNVFNKTKQ